MIQDNDIKKALDNIVTQPSSEWVDSLNEKLKHEIIFLQSKQKSYLLIFGMRAKYLAIGMVGLIVLGSSGLVTVSAAQASKPGDFLYGLEKSLEDFDRSRVYSTEDKLKFETEILDERISEVEVLTSETDAEKLRLALLELDEQYQRLIQQQLNCVDCTQELLARVQETLNVLEDQTITIKVKAQENNEVEIEVEAEDLENSARESQKDTLEAEQEIEKDELEVQHEQEKKSLEDLSEQEKKAIEQRQEEEKKQLEAQQEAEKKALEDSNDDSNSGSSNNNNEEDNSDSNSGEDQPEDENEDENSNND